MGKISVRAQPGEGRRLSLGVKRPGDHLHAAAAAPLFALGLTAVAVLTKAAGAGLGARLARLPWQEGNAIGAGMVARGEVALVMATLGLTNGLLNQTTFTAIILMAVATTIITPLLLRFTLVTPRAEPGASPAVAEPALVAESLAETP